MINWKCKLTFFMLCLMILINANAVELTNDQKDYNEIARNRTYPGGADEEDLKVRENLEEPRVTIYKSTIQQEIIKEIQEEKEKSTTETEKE